MLCLIRREGESINIGNDIVVTVLTIERNRVRVGVEAPRNITIDRNEITEAKKRGEPRPVRHEANGNVADPSEGDMP